MSARAELRALRRAARGVIQYMDRNIMLSGQAPGHSHDVPGVWNADNGALAGKPCDWCAQWAAFRVLAYRQAVNPKGPPAPKAHQRGRTARRNRRPVGRGRGWPWRVTHWRRS